jgi:DNA-binding transcriptional ArsR family regulator
MNVHMVVNTAFEPAAVAPIEELETLQVLVDSQRHRIVTLLMERPMTARELAAQLGIARTRLYYHLDLLEQRGVIRVVETRPVSGLAERSYRAVARAFRVDRALLATHASEPQIADTQAGLLDAMAADLRARATGGAPDEADADVLVGRRFLRLDERRRRDLRARLMALLDEYHDGDPEGRETEVGLALFTTGRDGR